jgi:glycosyltransferase involved in cell wall biosynthesis
MPCYNAAQTLPEAINSLKRQTFTDYEVLAVNDGSNDETAKLLRIRGARQIIRHNPTQFGLKEGHDWWSVA